MTQSLKRQNMLKLSIMNDENLKRKVQVVVLAGREVLMMEFNSTIPGNYIGFQNITGSVEAGEDFKDAAQRELLEESGIEAQVHELELFYEFTDRWQKNCLEKVYVCYLDNKPEVKLCSEHLNYKWVDLNEVTKHDYRFISNFEALEHSLRFLKENEFLKI